MTSSPPPPRLALLLGLALAAAAPAARAQVTQATVGAFTGETCAGTRAQRNLGCTAKDFTTSATFTQPPPGIASCVAGDTLPIDVILRVVSGSATRYAGAVFLGERGNDPSDMGGSCSLGVFPTGPAPFRNFDGDACGDYDTNATAELVIRGAIVYCAPAPGTNLLGLPYLVAFDNQVSGSCNRTNVTAATNSKCVSTTAATVTGVIVQGSVTVVERTVPAGDPQLFAYTATGGSPASFSLAHGGSRRVEVPLDAQGGNATLAITPTPIAGWRSSVSCATPSGGAAAYVAVNAATRQMTATLNATNFGAVCTVTHEKLPTLSKSFAPATARTGTASTLSFTISNPAGAAQAGLGFTDTFPAGLVVASPLATTTSCGGALTRPGTGAPLAAGDPGVAFAGGALAAGAPGCSVTVAVSAAAAGSYVNGPGQMSGLVNLASGVTAQALTVLAAPNLVVVETADSPTKRPGDVVTFTLSVQNAGDGAATSVVLGGPVSPLLAWRLGGFSGAAFQLVDGAPASGLTLGAPSYSPDGGATWLLAPASGGGGAPAGADARVTAWRLPLAGTMPAGARFSLRYQAVVR